MAGGAIAELLHSRELWLWLLAVVMMAVGLVGTIVPASPGVLLIYAGMWLAAWIDHYTLVGWPTLTLLGALTLLAFGADLVASVLGARRVGASRLALTGSVLGGLVGMAFGLAGLLFGPFLGAVAGELIARRHLPSAARAGVGTWIGLVFGTLAKIALAITMLGVFVAGLLL